VFVAIKCNLIGFFVLNAACLKNFGFMCLSRAIFSSALSVATLKFICFNQRKEKITLFTYNFFVIFYW
jgi:hypothetical protein